MIRRTHTHTSVFALAPCGHRLPVPNEAYAEPVELDPCTAPAGPLPPADLHLELGDEELPPLCGRRWIVAVVEVAGVPTVRFVDALAEPIAAAFHGCYERLAPDFGYATRADTAREWDEVPIENRALMVAVVSELLNAGIIALPALPDPSTVATGDTVDRHEYAVGHVGTIATDPPPRPTVEVPSLYLGAPADPSADRAVDLADPNPEELP